MAIQDGIIKLRGTIDDITFKRTADGKMIAHKKSRMDKQRIMTDTAFKRTRENMLEFARAGKAAVVLTSAARLLLTNVKDRTLNRRLLREFIRVVKADNISTRGQRNVVDGEAELLQDFELNSNSSLKKTLLKDFVSTIDRVTGKLEVNIPSIQPLRDILAPAGATHCKIVSGGYAINFETETFVVQETETPMMVLDLNSSVPLTLTNNLTPNSTHPLFLVLGVQFFQDVNGDVYPLLEGSFNPLKIVQVSGM